MKNSVLMRRSEVVGYHLMRAVIHDALVVRCVRYTEVPQSSRAAMSGKNS